MTEQAAMKRATMSHMPNHQIKVVALTAVLQSLVAAVVGPCAWGAGPWVLSDERVNYLLAGEVCREVNLEESRAGTKLMGVGHWCKPEQEFRWPVTAAAPGSCSVELLVDTPGPGTAMVLSSDIDTVEVAPAEGGWLRVPATLKVGRRDTIKLKLKGELTGERTASILGIEVITAAHLPVHQKRLAEARTSVEEAAWFQNAGFGIMFQWGNWGYPRSGGKKQPWSRIYEEFVIEKFADKMESFHPGYLVWSVSWRGSRFAAPLKSVEKIMGSRDYTMEYDFLGKLTDAFAKRGIPVLFYYHPGTEEPEYWRAVWHGRGDMQAWEDANVAIWTEIGERLGTKLSGWFVDDGIGHYYPADFHRYIMALKTGNPRRIVSFNPWRFPICSYYEDMAMGEIRCQGKIENGRLASGKDTGLMPHNMIIMDGPDWGIFRPDTRIHDPKGNLADWQRKVDEAKATKHPLTLTILMYEDGTIGEKTEAILRQLKR